MYEDNTDVFILAGLACIILLVVVFAAVHPSQNIFVELGDEVETTDEYNALFNDSFTGHVVAVRDGMYMVRCENGTEREFAFKWLDKYTQEEVI